MTIAFSPEENSRFARLRAVARGVGVAWLLSGAPAIAQDRDPAAAQALFDQARELTRQGRFAEACPKLQESNRLDPGIGTQFHLADCYEQSGRVASAWATFLDVASQARAASQPDREKAAIKRAEKLQPRLPRVIVDVPEASLVPGLEVRRNGVLVGSAQWGTPVAVDPGEVELVASAPDRQTLKHTLRVEEGKTTSFSLPPLAEGQPVTASVAAPSAAPPAAPPAAAPGSAPVPAPAPEAASRAGGSGPWVAVLAGVGVVGLGLGGTFALLAKSKYDESKKQCDVDDVNSCRSSGVELRDEARTKGDIATVSFIVGGAAITGAGVVWLVGSSSDPKQAATPRRLHATPVVGPNLAALFVQGRF